MSPLEKADRSNRNNDRLSPSRYDDDASSLRSASDQETDSEDDEVLLGARTSAEIVEHDLSILREEEERERLITGSNKNKGLGIRRIFSGGHDEEPQIKKMHKREQRKQRRRGERAARRKKKGKTDEEGELMYEMEEGAFRDSSDSSGISSDIDYQKFSHTFNREKSSTRQRRCTLALIHAAIVVLFAIFVLAAWKATHTSNKQLIHPGILSNGTSLFAPTTILISLDGFRADFLKRGLTPTLNSFIDEGISPLYMLPSFPSVTFPNHFTLVTGLYPESHGVVGNTFWDPSLQDEFYYTDTSNSMQPKWWDAEPIWATLEKQGIRTGIHMWPGSEAHIGGIEPTYVDKFNGTEELSRKVDRILELLDLPGTNDTDSESQEQRPQLIASYVPIVDADGHKYGPNSTQIRSTISRVDTMLSQLFKGLESRNLTSIVNVIVVSDHGMATTSTNRLIQLEDLVNPELLSHIDGWPLYGLRPKNSEDLQAIYASILNKTKENPNVEVYLRDKNMPKRYHFKNNDRIAPLWIIPKTGWAIVKKEDFDVNRALAAAEEYHPRGLHGYDHEHPLMRAIFIARGPSFPHRKGSRVEIFRKFPYLHSPIACMYKSSKRLVLRASPTENTNVYPILCDTLDIEPLPNNGTLRLPLKPVGLHSDPDASPLDTPSDPPPSNEIPTDQDQDSDDDEGEDKDEDKDDDENEDSKKNIWDIIGEKVASAKGWAEALWGTVKDKTGYGEEGEEDGTGR
ncbi:MAG: ectonucleotide pyrophosphatase phosphodiesterase [Cirrosporium novae-zelandiae]|nr:MAG: ectonucleotide pyrophosphatase phosphodiesterase [Cirrosporium novae-zelandiae]